MVVGGGVLGAPWRCGSPTTAARWRGSTTAIAGAWRRPRRGACLGVFSEVWTGEADAERHDAASRRLDARRRIDPWLADLAERTGVAVATTDGTFVVGNGLGEGDDLELAVIAEAAHRAGRPADALSWREVPGLRPDAAVTPIGALHLPDEGSIDTEGLLDALEAALGKTRACGSSPVGPAGSAPSAPVSSWSSTTRRPWRAARSSWRRGRRAARSCRTWRTTDVPTTVTPTGRRPRAVRRGAG